MKKIKHKLFFSYLITLLFVLLLLCASSIYFFNLNKESKSIELLQETYKTIESTIENKKSLNIDSIDRYVDLQNQFLIIFKNGKLGFSNQSKFRTETILEEIYYEIEDEIEHRLDEDDHHHDRQRELQERYEDYAFSEYIEIKDYNLIVNYFESGKDSYEIYLGIDEIYLDRSLDDIYMMIISLSIIIFVILIALGYVLINRTIDPMKQILAELKALQKEQDLSKRLKAITTKDEFEELTNTFNEMLDHIEKSVESIKQFSSDASHELKTPLTVIQGHIELLQEKEPTKEELLEVVEKIDAQQHKLQDIVQSLLILSRLDKEAEVKQKTSLDHAIFESIESNLEAIEEKGLELVINVEEGVYINFDHKYLAIVINNLLSNAIKYTNEGVITIKAHQESDHTKLTIKDSGIGLSQEDQQRIFERFYRVDQSRGYTTNGLGLGLSIVKKICDKFDIKIKVKSKIDEGSQFILEFENSL